MYIHTCIHTYTHTYMRICIYAYIRINIQTYIHKKLICTYIQKVCIYIMYIRYVRRYIRYVNYISKFYGLSKHLYSVFCLQSPFANCQLLVMFILYKASNTVFIWLQSLYKIILYRLQSDLVYFT